MITTYRLKLVAESRLNVRSKPTNAFAYSGQLPSSASYGCYCLCRGSDISRTGLSLAVADCRATSYIYDELFDEKVTDRVATCKKEEYLGRELSPTA